MNLNAFLEKKNIEISAKRYFIDAMSAMAMGLFASLLVGTILNTVGLKLNIKFLTEIIWPMCKEMTGVAIGVAIAHSLKAHTFVLFSASIVGYAGNKYGGPVGAFISSIIATELGKVVSRETKIDLIVTPMVTILSGCVIAVLLGPLLSSLMKSTGSLIMSATKLAPFWMGMTISVLVGMILTLPISSAAICMMLSLEGIAGGAATVGCCAQMIGFAVMSYKDNGLGGAVAVGIGTSMLHVPNIIKNPFIWVPPTLSALILGPMATILFKFENIALASGMGSCGFVGQIGTLTAMSEINRSGCNTYLAILFLHFIAPAILTLAFSIILRKMNLIKDGDLKLDF